MLQRLFMLDIMYNFFNQLHLYLPYTADEDEINNPVE